MKRILLVKAGAAILLALASPARAESESADPESRVAEVERAFAKSMADRNHAAFESFLSEEATFLSETTVLRGKQAVTERWRAFFAGPEPPFSWAPETISVLDSGNLALSTGPVWDPEGKRLGTYSSIWRQEEPGVWRIVFDRGNKYCEESSGAGEQDMSQSEQDRRMDYIEFPATDLGDIKKFYAAVFGWEFTDYGPDYTSFNDGRLGGGFRKEAQVSAGGPLVVLYATSLEGIQAKVREHGGRITKPTFEFPGGRRFHFTDPSGNELAVWSE